MSKQESENVQSFRDLQSLASIEGYLGLLTPEALQDLLDTPVEKWSPGSCHNVYTERRCLIGIAEDCDEFGVRKRESGATMGNLVRVSHLFDALYNSLGSQEAIQRIQKMVHERLQETTCQKE